jgi:hypothetical protein
MTVTQLPEEVHMPDDQDPNSTATETQPTEHHSTFAEGECEPETHPEEKHVGAFAEAQETPAAPS